MVRIALLSSRWSGAVRLLAVVLLGLGAVSAFAQTDCRSITDPTQRLACYDKQYGAPPATSTTTPQTPTPPQQPAPQPPPTDRRFWVSFEAGVGSTSNGHDNLGIFSGAPVFQFSTGRAKIPTSPGFIGLYTVQNIATGINGEQLVGPSNGVQPSGTLRVGHWLDADHRHGIEFELSHTAGSQTRVFLPDGNTLAVPGTNMFGTAGTYAILQPTTLSTTQVFVNTTPDVYVGLYDQIVLNEGGGALGVQESNGFYTLDGNYRTRVKRSPNASLYMLYGLRYASLYDRLKIGTGTTALQDTFVNFQPALGLPGTPSYVNVVNRDVATTDLLRASNHFVGPQIGLAGDYRWKRYWAEGDAKIAVGADLETMKIGGVTEATTLTSTQPTNAIFLAGIPLSVGNGAPPVTSFGTTTTAGAIFAQPSNSGSNSSPVFSMMPAISGRFGYDVTPRLSAFVGYRLFMLTTATTTHDAGLVPGAVEYGERSYWQQSANFGLRYQF